MTKQATEGADRRRSRRDMILWHVKENAIIILMVLALTIGVVVGLTVRKLDGWEYYEKKKIFYLRFPGDLLMNMLKLLILPLIVSSIISSLASLNAKASGRIGLRAVVYYMTTTFAAVIMGIVLVLAIRPGKQGSGEFTREGEAKEQEPLEALFDLIRNCFPDNLLEAAFRRMTTKTGEFEYQIEVPRNMSAPTTVDPVTNMTDNSSTVYPFTNMTDNSSTVDPFTNTTDNSSTVDLFTNTTDNSSTMMINMTSPSPKVVKEDGMNILGVVVFSVFLGATISSMGEAGKPLADFFECLHHATMKLTMLVIWYSPIGIIFLVATKLIEMENPETIFVQLAYYMLTVLAGLFAHGLIVLPLVYFVCTRKNPFTFMYGMVKALLTAWGTASSSATLPVTMECLEMNNNIDIRVAKFVAPIGATINMDGTALYEAVAAIFISQVNNIGLNVGQVITVSLTATAAAIGAAGIPSAGLVTMTIVLTAVGLPTEDVSLILAIDWFLDRFRTAINVLGDSYGAGIVEHLSKNDLHELDEEHARDMMRDSSSSDMTSSTNVNDIEVKVMDNGKKLEAGIHNPTFVNGDSARL